MKDVLVDTVQCRKLLTNARTHGTEKREASFRGICLIIKNYIYL